MFLSAFERPDFSHRTAIIFRGCKYTYGEVAAEARQIAGGLQSVGIRQGDHVALHFRNSNQFVAAYLACQLTGVVAVPIRHSESTALVILWCNHLGVKCVMASDGLFDRIAPRVGELTSTQTVITPAQAIMASRVKDYQRVISSNGKPMLIVHTSGSTARPKAVMQDLDALNTRARALIEYLPFRPDDVVCTVSDLTHGFGLHTLATPAFAIGAAVMLFDQSEFDPKHIIQEAVKEGATIIGSNPITLRKLLYAARDSMERPRLRFAFSSTDQLPDHIALQWEEVFAAPLLEAWGMTEACSCILFNRPGDHEIGTVGRPLPNVRVRIVGPDGRDVPDGELGEMWIASDFLFSGYWNDPEATSRVSEGGWFRTGDQCFRNRNGRYRFVGRGGHMIKHGGILVSPFEIESAIVQHPAIAECVAIGVPSPEWGQDIDAFVTLRSRVSAQELHAHAATTLSVASRPARYWSVPAIPKTSADKVARSVGAYASAERL